MIEVLIYLLESSLILMLMYLIYATLLKGETFFNFNRFFLLTIPICSLALPLFHFNSFFIQVPVIKDIHQFRRSYYQMMEGWEEQIAAGTIQNEATSISGINGWMLFLGLILLIYVIGMIFQLTKTWLIYRQMNHMTSLRAPIAMSGLQVILLPELKSPFSFMKTVFIPEELEKSQALDQILTHEKTHVRQGHTYDLIFVQLMAAIFWFNPFIWRLINALKTIHEYIADKNVIKRGYSLVAYQTMLLRQVISDNSHELVHNFNFSFIKRRIAMMNHKKSGWTGKTKVMLSLSITLILALVVTQGNAWMNAEQVVESTIQPYLDDQHLDQETGVKISTIEQRDFKGVFSVKVDNIDAADISYEATQVREGIGLNQVKGEGPIDLLDFFRNIKVGEWVVIEVTTPDKTTFIKFPIVE
ncbi:MAG: M56 family metallopeptidase [Cytophagales bacterium]|nr:M56 family metallopeptidase [Cytophagales bacterium]